MTVGITAAIFALALAAGITLIRLKKSRAAAVICFVISAAAALYCIAALILLNGIN